MRRFRLTVALCASLCGLDGCSGGPPIAPDAAMLARAVCRPIFMLNGVPTDAGTAFLVRDPLAPTTPLLVTAHHLFGMAEGRNPGMRWNEAPRRVTSAECHTLDGAHVWRTGHALAITGARALWSLAKLRDIALFHLAPGQANAAALTISPRSVRVGDTVWLMAATANPLEAGHFLHRARVVTVTPYLGFLYDDPLILLGNTSGGPIVNAAGQVVGVNVGGAHAARGRLGVADNLAVLNAALVDARSQ